MEVIAWGANPHTLSKKGSRKNMAKKKRSAAQKAATRKMLAANKASKRHGKKRKGSKGSRKGHGKGKKHSHWHEVPSYSRKKTVKGHRRRTNPFGSLSMSSGLGAMAMHGLAAGAGGILTLAVTQAVIPMSLRNGGMQEGLIKGLVGLALGAVAHAIPATRKFAPAIATGGIVVGLEVALAPTVLAAGPKNLLGEAYYLAELNVRKLTALGTTPAAAKSRLLGELDKRTGIAGGAALANQNRAMVRGSAAAMEPQ